MSKSVLLRTLIRIVIISALLFCSYYIYEHYTGKAIRMIEMDIITGSLILHLSIFFLIGVVLKLDTPLIAGIKKRTLKVNFLKIGLAVILLIALVLLILKHYSMYLHISCLIAFLTGLFLAEAFECEQVE